jgi:hypothetical protein
VTVWRELFDPPDAAHPFYLYAEFVLPKQQAAVAEST